MAFHFKQDSGKDLTFISSLLKDSFFNGLVTLRAPLNDFAVSSDLQMITLD